MLRTMITATNTMGELQKQLNLIGHNMSNSSTTGYKAQETKFQELLVQQFDNDKRDPAPRVSPDGVRYGTGAAIAQSGMNWKNGSLQVTGRPLDFAFKVPKQYFKVRMETETGIREAYTRQGAFQAVPAEGGNLMLVTPDGYPVLDSNDQPIRFSDDATDYKVTDNGNLLVTHADGSETAFGFGVVELQRPQLMEQLSSAYIALPNLETFGVAEQDVLRELQGEARETIQLQNEALESSNVDMQKEMTNLINTQRSYQFNARAVSIADQMLGLINGIR